ncbi:phosphoglycerate mutase-like protein [Poronia punctata]|nr:phosphoglycerate mutase-like protein [Poronia punctata]
MFSRLFIGLLSLSEAVLASEVAYRGSDGHTRRPPCHISKPSVEYSTIPGFFLQDNPHTDPDTFDYTLRNFGLINRPYSTDGKFDPHRNKTQWQRFEHYVETLNAKAGKDTQYKVLFLARHGEGYHNIAESYYGTPAWNCYWGPLEGNGTYVWRDARLSEAGLAQCTKSHEFWKHALVVEKIPAPQTYYSSPLIRSATTANLTFGGLDLPEDRPFTPTIKELLREGISMRTCDLRSNKTYIASLLPNFRFGDGFTENDELWRGDEGETAEAEFRRIKNAMDDIFTSDDSTWISITTHSGQIKVNLEVLRHKPFSLSTGQAIPVLVKAHTLKVHQPTTTIKSWVVEPTCTSPPVASISGQGCVCSTAPSAFIVATPAPTSPQLAI